MPSLAQFLAYQYRCTLLETLFSMHESTFHAKGYPGGLLLRVGRALATH